MVELLNRDNGTDAIEAMREDLRERLPLPPTDIIVNKEGNAVRVSVKERGRLISAGQISTASTYLLYWVASADTTTPTGVEAAGARAVHIGDVGRTYIDGDEISGPLLTDAKYASGYYMTRGATPNGQFSDWLISAQVSLAILDSSLPANVLDLQVSGAGEAANDTTLEDLAFTYRAPIPIGSFAGIQPVIDDYPNVGNRSEFTPLMYPSGVPGGQGGGLLRIALARRKGSGTISISAANPGVVTGVGNNPFASFAKVNDQIEVFGVQARIASIDSPTQMTLTGLWTGPMVTTVGDYVILGKCRVYAVSIAQDLSHAQDPTTSPYVDVDLDGSLGPPNTVSSITLTPFGLGIRVQFQQVSGLGVKKYLLFRSKGSLDVFTDTTQTTLRKEFMADPTNPVGGTLITWEDTDFLVYDMNNAQVFAYYVVTVNVREQRSASHAFATAPCRLISPVERHPGAPHQAADNLLWNGMCWFNANATINSTNANQDTKMGGNPPPAGFYRWDHEETLGKTPAGFQNSTEIILPSPGNPAYCACKQRMDSWDSATGHIPRGSYVVVQFKARISGGAIAGLVRTDIGQYDNTDTLIDYAFVSKRLSNDAIDETSKVFDFDPTTLLTTYTLFWAIFHLRVDIGCDHIKLRIYWQNDTVGVANINLTDIMVSIGNDLPLFSAHVPGTPVLYVPPTGGAPTPGRQWPDKDGFGGNNAQQVI